MEKGSCDGDIYRPNLRILWPKYILRCEFILRGSKSEHDYQTKSTGILSLKKLNEAVSSRACYAWKPNFKTVKYSSKIWSNFRKVKYKTVEGFKNSILEHSKSLKTTVSIFYIRKCLRIQRNITQNQSSMTSFLSSWSLPYITLYVKRQTKTAQNPTFFDKFSVFCFEVPPVKKSINVDESGSFYETS